MIANETELKAAAARSAVALLMDGMTVGLGSGTTAALAISELARRVTEGLRIVGIPTSERTAAQARNLGIPLAELSGATKIDLTIDGADQVEQGTLHLVKGHGGALLREKIVASASRRLVIIVHETKLVGRLVASGALPIEIVPFGWEVTARRLSDLGARPALRRNPDGQPFHSDSGNYIVDCEFPAPVSAPELAERLDHVVGVVEHGLFIGLTSEVHVAGADGVRVLK